MTLVVTIDGVDKSEADLVTAGVTVQMARTGYTDAEPATFRTNDAFDAGSPMLVSGQIVRVKSDGVVLAYGKVVESKVGFQPGEGREFTLIPARELARNVIIQHPRTQAASIDFNMGETHDLHPTALEGLSVGDMIAYVIDAMATQLRAQGAAPAVGNIYDAAVLALLTAEVPKVQVSGDVVAVVENLLALTKYALVIDPDTLAWTFNDLTAGSYFEVDLAADHVVGEVATSTKRSFTAAEIRGSQPETTDTVYSIAGGDLALPAADQAKLASLSPATRWDDSYKSVGKLLEMADGDVGVLRDLCAQARVTSADGAVDISTPVRGATPEVGAASIAVPLPTVGLVNFVNQVDPCSDPSGQADADQGTGGLSVTLPTYSRASPLVPKLRYPTASDAWYGGAFSTNPAHWGVNGATPAAGSVGLKRLRIFSVPQYTGAAGEVTAWTKVLQDLVAKGGTLQREAKFTIGGRIENTLVLLGKRLRVKDTAGRTTGYETTTDLTIVGVEWSFDGPGSTTIYAGSAAGLLDLDAYRAGLTQRQYQERSERSLELLRELQACFRAQDQAYVQGDIPPVAICASQVTTRMRPGSPPVPVDAPPNAAIPAILAILTFQKGGLFYTDVGDDGEVEVHWNDTKPGGKDWTYNSESGMWEDGSGNEDPAPFGTDPDGDGPAPPLPNGGAEGWMANAILALLGNAGKTLDDQGNEVPEGDPAPGATPGAPGGPPGTSSGTPGSPGGTGGTPGNPAGGGGGGGATSFGTGENGSPFIIPIPPTNIVPPATMPGVLSSIGGTKDKYGSLLQPGATIV